MNTIEDVAAAVGTQKNKQLTSAQLNFVYKRKIRGLKSDLVLKDEEMNNLKRNIKFTKMKEYETEIKTFKDEGLRLRRVLQAEINLPKINPMLYA